MKRLLIIILLVGTAALAKQKKLIGKAADPSALLKVQTFCVDPGQLAGAQADDLKHFVAEQSKPARILTKLPWRLDSACTNPDAVATLSVQFTSETAGGAYGISVINTRNYLSTLSVSERSSGKVLYQVKGDQNMREDDSFISPFAKLEKDLNFVQETNAK